MSQLAKFAPIAVLGLLLLAVAGCNQSSVMDAKTLAAYRTGLTLTEEPDGVQTVFDVRTTLLGEGHLDHDDHDHDGDGHQDHDAADHDAAKHAHDDHDDHEAGHDDHDAHDDHKADHDEHAHEESTAHDDHDHDGDGHQDHDAADHDDHDHAGHAHATEPQDVVIVGHIGGLANPWAEAQPDFPFAKAQAVFFLADPEAVVHNEESGHSHAPGEECSFCAAHATDQSDMLAMVQFVDKKGNVLPTDVRQLFDVKEKDTVVVRGKARVTAGGILVVDAQGLYIRK